MSKKNKDIKNNQNDLVSWPDRYLTEQLLITPLQESERIELVEKIISILRPRRMRFQEAKQVLSVCIFRLEQMASRLEFYQEE